MFTIRLSINGNTQDVVVFATTLFSAMNEAERLHGGKAIGGTRS